MTQSVELPLARLTGNGVTTAFAANFTVFDLDDVLVGLRDTDDREVSVGLNGAAPYDYVVTGTFSPTAERYSSVTVTFNAAPPSGYKVGLSRAGLQEQALDLTAGGVLPAESLEHRFDRLVSMVQDLQAQADRALKQPLGSAAVFDGGNARITNVADPIDDHDVITKAFVGSVTVTTVEIEVSAGTLIRFKPSQTGITNNAVPFADPDLSGAALVAGVTYAIEGLLVVGATANNAGFRFALSAPTNSIFNFAISGSLVNASGTLQNVSAAAGGVGQVLVYTIQFGIDHLIHVVGTVLPNVDLDMDLVWAQATANAAITNLHAGSWLRYTPLGPAPI